MKHLSSKKLEKAASWVKKSEEMEEVAKKLKSQHVNAVVKVDGDYVAAPEPSARIQAEGNGNGIFGTLTKEYKNELAQLLEKYSEKIKQTVKLDIDN